MNQITAFVPFIGAVVAAMIAAGAALVVAILSKEIKMSEFRQAWINDLRDEIADLVSIAQMTRYAASAKRGINPTITKEALAEYMMGAHHEDMVKARTMLHKVLLRLNPSEPDSRRLAEACTAYVTQAPVDARDDDATAKDAQALVALGHAVLKAEWRRVGDGEPMYQSLKNTMRQAVWWLAAAAVLGATFVAVIAFIDGGTRPAIAPAPAPVVATPQQGAPAAAPPQVPAPSRP